MHHSGNYNVENKPCHHESSNDVKASSHIHDQETNVNHFNSSQSHNNEHSCTSMHGGHHGKMITDFKKRFWISLALTIPVLILSPMLQELFHFNFVLPGSAYILLVLSTIIYFFGGWPFIKGLYDEITAKNPGMMTLIAVAITAAYLYSVATVLGLSGHEFFWELGTLIDIMLLGHWLEMKSILGASKALEYLVAMLPQTAHLLKGEEIIDVKLEAIQIGDTLLIKPGEKVPADGKIMDGLSYLNESMLTGESKPIKKTTHDPVIGGSINGNGSLKIKVQHTGKDSYLSKVINLVQEAQQTKSKTQNLADRAARWLTFVALAIGAVTFAAWLGVGKDITFALERMITVMVISCPHALGLAVPLVVAISTTLSAQHGLLIRNRTAFEDSRKITTLVFDKTGTLTKGSFEVTNYGSLDQDYEPKEILRLAGSVEQNSEHPIALGILKAAKNKGLTLSTNENFCALPGEGVHAQVNGKNIKIVSPGYLTANSIAIPAPQMTNSSETIVIVLIDKKPVGSITLADEIREESYAAINTFRKERIKTIMLTGDNKEVAKAVSDKLGLDKFYAEISPHQKLDIIKELQSQNEFVAMTGDGVNDAPALAQADIGIAVGSGTDVAAETADIILVESNPQDISALISFGKATYRKMIQNLIWATGYNIVAVPLAAGVLYNYGVILSPAVGAILMSLSTIIVAFNAQTLRKQIFRTINQ